MALPRISEPADRVLDHDHGRIDHQAEVQRAEREQAGGDAEAQHAVESHEHRQRDRQGHDQARAQVAQEDEEDRDDHEAALEQVRAHRLDDVVHQLGTVIEHRRLDVSRKEGADLIELRLEAGRHRVRVLAHEHEAEPEHGLALPIGSHRAVADLMTDPHGPDVVHGDGDAILRSDHDAPDFRDGGDATDTLDQRDGSGPFDDAATDVEVARADLLQHLAEGQAMRDHALRVDLDLVLLFVASPGIDLGDAGHSAKGRLDNPVLNGARGGEVVAERADPVVEDLTEAGRDRSHLRPADALGQLDSRQPLGEELAGEVDVGPIGEDHGDLGQAGLADRIHALDARQARDGLLDRRGDLPFDLLGR